MNAQYVAMHNSYGATQQSPLQIKTLQAGTCSCPGLLLGSGALVGRALLVLRFFEIVRTPVGGRSLACGMGASLLGAVARRSAPGLRIARLAVAWLARSWLSRPCIGRFDADILVVGLAHGRGELRGLGLHDLELRLP